MFKSKDYRPETVWIFVVWNAMETITCINFPLSLFNLTLPQFQPEANFTLDGFLPRGVMKTATRMSNIDWVKKCFRTKVRVMI